MSQPKRRHYDVLTDTMLEEVTELTAPDAQAGYTPWPDVRHQALLAAIEAAKLGLAHDIYQTAARYAAWLATGEVEAPPALPFAVRLQALVDECKRSGEVDDNMIIHHMQIVMGIHPEPFNPGAAP